MITEDEPPKAIKKRGNGVARSLYRWITFYVPILVVTGFVIYVVLELFMKTLAMRTVQALDHHHLHDEQMVLNALHGTFLASIYHSMIIGWIDPSKTLFRRHLHRPCHHRWHNHQ